MLIVLEAYKHLGPTDELRAFWTFIAERQNAYWRRLSGGSQPWSRDPVIQSRAFTNVYRVLDKASQYVIREVINGPDQMDYKAEQLFRVLVFRTFGLIEPYETVKATVGGNICLEAFLREPAPYHKAFASIPNKWPLYTGATWTPAGDTTGHRDMILSTTTPDVMMTRRSLSDASAWLRQFPGVGRFASLQFALDINYLEFIDWDEMDPVPLGPGGRWGLALLFDDLPHGREQDEIARQFALDHLDWFDHYQLDWRPLQARPLQTVDIEHCLCEFQRYVRQRKLLAEGLEPTPFTGTSTLPQPVLPAKWS